MPLPEVGKPGTVGCGTEPSRVEQSNAEHCSRTVFDFFAAFGDVAPGRFPV